MSDSTVDIPKLADEVMKTAKSAIDRIKKVHGIDGFISAIPDVVKIVEAFSEKKALASADKKALAVEILNRIIDIPLIPESVEGVMISWGIELAISSLNKLIGKDWLEKTV